MNKAMPALLLVPLVFMVGCLSPSTHVLPTMVAEAKLRLAQGKEAFVGEASHCCGGQELAGKRKNCPEDTSGNA